MDTLTQDIRIRAADLPEESWIHGRRTAHPGARVGANTAIFSVVNAVLIRALPHEEPGSLVVLWGNVQRGAVERRGASRPDVADWRAEPVVRRPRDLRR